MSAAFKNSKKKLSQVELRRFMNDHKVKKTTKVDSPLAKYNDLGQLTCVLCQTVVRSESVWNVHVNSKQHRDKVDEAKRLKVTTNNFTTPLKRSYVTPIEVSNKKLKSILKNGISNGNTVENTNNDDILSDTNQDQTETKISVIDDKQHEIVVEAKGDSAVIPEGFFDDPKQDAKVRHIDYKDPIEEEWEKFQKAIRDANNESANIIAEDHEEATNERQLDEIDEQMKNWSKVLTLERKKTEVKFSVNNQNDNSDQSEVSDDEINFEEYLDWRTKKCFTV